MKLFQWHIFFFLVLSPSSPLYAQDPKSVVSEYFDCVFSQDSARAYDLISSEDKEFGSSPWPFLYEDTFDLYLDLFSIEIVDAEIKDNRAYVKFKFIGPSKLYLQAWKELSRENQKKISNEGKSDFNSSSEFLKLLEERIKKIIANKNYSVDEQIRTVELIKENEGWRLHLNLRGLKEFQEALKIISRVDRELGYIKYGQIHLDSHDADERHRIYQKAMIDYERSKGIMDALTFVSEDDIKNQKKVLSMIENKIDELAKKISEESEKQ